MKLPSDIPIRVLQSCASAAEEYQVPLRLLLGLTWVETQWSERAGMRMLPPIGELARTLAQLKSRLLTWERVLAARYWGARRVAERPDPDQWPVPVLQHIEQVHRAGQAARVPFTGPIWTLPRLGGGRSHAA